MKIGDIVLNHHAGLKNPYRISMYIGMSGKDRKCLCMDGHISLYDKDTNLEVVGHLPFKKELEKEWLGKSDAQKATSNSEYKQCIHPLLRRGRIDKHTLICHECGSKL